MTDIAEIPDASDEITTNNRQRDVARARRQDADVIRKLMHDPAGRAWLYRLLENSHIYDNPFVPGEADTTAFRLGEQNIGKRLLAQVMDASPDLYLTMIREAKEEDARVAKTNRERNEAEVPRASDLTADAQYPENMQAPEGFKK